MRAEHQRLQRRVPHRDRSACLADRSRGGAPGWRGRSARAPVDILDPAGALVEDARQLVDDPVFRRDDDVGERAAAESLRGRSRAIASERDEDLAVVRTAVVAVLILLTDLADHGVRAPFSVDRFAEDVALAEELLGHVEADDSHAREPAARPANAKLRPYSSSMVRMS